MDPKTRKAASSKARDRFRVHGRRSFELCRIRENSRVPSRGSSGRRGSSLVLVGRTSGRIYGFLASAGAEDNVDPRDVHAAIGPRETALMMIVEAAHQADDLRRHPGSVRGTEATLKIVHRYLTALGYTAYNAVRELNDPVDTCALSVHRVSDGAVSAIWMLRPIGTILAEADIDRAQELARRDRAPVAVATNGIQLVGVIEGSRFDVDLREVGREHGHFDGIACTRLVCPRGVRLASTHEKGFGRRSPQPPSSWWPSSLPWRVTAGHASPVLDPPTQRSG